MLVYFQEIQYEIYVKNIQHTCNTITIVYSKHIKKLFFFKSYTELKGK